MKTRKNTISTKEITETDNISLRDYFAAKAEIPYNVLFDIIEKQYGVGNVTLSIIAEKRAEYKFIEADAMLKQRELPTETK